MTDPITHVVELGRIGAVVLLLWAIASHLTTARLTGCSELVGRPPALSPI